MYEKISKVLFIPKIGGNRVEEALQIISYASAWAIHKGFKVLEKESQIDSETLLIPVGGDGTVIHAAKTALKYDVPIIGFNLGNVGFLTDLEIQTEEKDKVESDSTANSVKFEAFFGDLKHRELFKIEERMLLEINHQGRDYLALNDFVMSNVYADHIIKYELEIGNSYAGKHKANSVIISTPTGSTAYSLMAGGSIIEPDLEVMEIVAVAALTMTSRPIIVNSDRAITVKLDVDQKKKNSFISCKADGQQVLLLSKDEPKLTISKHKKKLKLIHYYGWNYFKNLTAKLGWAK